MKSRTTIIIIAVIAITAIIYFQAQMIKGLRSEKERWEGNSESLGGVDSSAYTLNLLVKEFKKFYPVLDSIAKKNNIPVKNITEVYHTHIHNEITDTITKPLYVVDSTLRGLSFDTLCFSFDILMNPVLNKASITKLSYDTDMQLFYYIQRQRVKWLFGLRIGKKMQYAKAVSSCGDSINIERINLYRNKRMSLIDR